MPSFRPLSGIMIGCWKSDFQRPTASIALAATVSRRRDRRQVHTHSCSRTLQLPMVRQKPSILANSPTSTRRTMGGNRCRHTHRVRHLLHSNNTRCTTKELQSLPSQTAVSTRRSKCRREAVVVGAARLPLQLNSILSKAAIRQTRQLLRRVTTSNKCQRRIN